MRRKDGKPDVRATERANRLVNPALGRAGKFTEEAREAVLAHLRLGGYVDDAAQLAGVTEQTLYEWIARGRAEEERRATHEKHRRSLKGRPAKKRADRLHEALCAQNEPYLVFAGDVSKAQSFASAAMLSSIARVATGNFVESTTTTTTVLPDGSTQTQTIEKRAPPNWQAAAWRMERRHPKKWGRQQRVELTGGDGKPVQVDYLGQLAGALDRAADAEGADEDEDDGAADG